MHAFVTSTIPPNIKDEQKYLLDMAIFSSRDFFKALKGPTFHNILPLFSVTELCLKCLHVNSIKKITTYFKSSLQLFSCICETTVMTYFLKFWYSYFLSNFSLLIGRHLPEDYRENDTRMPVYFRRNNNKTVTFPHY